MKLSLWAAWTVAVFWLGGHWRAVAHAIGRRFPWLRLQFPSWFGALLVLLPACLNAQAVVDSTTATHEPAGFTRISSRPCDAVTEDGWGTPTSGHLRIVIDPVRGNVCQTTFPAGYRAGAAPVTTGRSIPTPWPSRIYLRYWALTSANWQSHPILTKQFHFWINTKAGNGGGNRGLTALTGPSTARFYTQGTLSQVGKQPGTANVSRGIWHLHELLLIGGTAGRVTYWLDGRQFLDVPVTWGLASSPNRWEKISWSPTYGGLGAPVPFTMTEAWDDLYLSGAP